MSNGNWASELATTRLLQTISTELIVDAQLFGDYVAAFKLQPGQAGVL